MRHRVESTIAPAFAYLNIYFWVIFYPRSDNAPSVGGENFNRFMIIFTVRDSNTKGWFPFAYFLGGNVNEKAYEL